MLVYIVMRDLDGVVAGVFGSREKAEEYIDSIKNEVCDYLYIEEWGVK